jgi:putative transposase
MDESHLFHAVRYVSLNPVCARLVPQAQDWRWLSVVAHLSGKDDKLVEVAPILVRYGNFTAFLDESTVDDPGFKHLRHSETTGRPLGSEEWIERLEKMTGNTLKPQKRGPKTKDREASRGIY